MDVKSLCLGVLSLGDKSGYEIKKHFELSFSHFFTAGYGSIYPALATLTDQGLVECTSVAQEKRPDKKVYRVTKSGRSALLEVLLSTPPTHKIRSAFFVLLYFANLMPQERLAGVLDQRTDDIEATLAMLNGIETAECDLPVHHEFVLGLGRSCLEAQLAYIHTHRKSLKLASPAAT